MEISALKSLVEEKFGFVLPDTKKVKETLSAVNHEISIAILKGEINRLTVDDFGGGFFASTWQGSVNNIGGLFLSRIDGYLLSELLSDFEKVEFRPTHWNGRWYLKIDPVPSEAILSAPLIFTNRFDFDGGMNIEKADKEQKIEYIRDFFSKMVWHELFSLAIEGDKSLTPPDKSQVEKKVADLGEKLYREVEEISLKTALKVKRRFGEFVPFKLSVDIWVGALINTPKDRIKELRDIADFSSFGEEIEFFVPSVMIYPRIIPYPFASEGLITSPEQAIEELKKVEKSFEETVERFLSSEIVKESGQRDSLEKSIVNAVANNLKAFGYAIGKGFYYKAEKIAERLGVNKPVETESKTIINLPRVDFPIKQKNAIEVLEQEYGIRFFNSIIEPRREEIEKILDSLKLNQIEDIRLLKQEFVKNLLFDFAFMPESEEKLIAFQTDKISFKQSASEKNRKELFQHFYDRVAEYGLFRMALGNFEMQTPMFLNAVLINHLVSIGQEMFKKLKHYNPAVAYEIADKFGEFLPFKIEMHEFHGTILKKKGLVIPQFTAMPKIIPYPISNKEEDLITTPEKALRWFEKYKNYGKNLRERIENDEFASEFVDEETLNYLSGNAFKLNQLRMLYIALNKMSIFSPQLVVEKWYEMQKGFYKPVRKVILSEEKVQTSKTTIKKKAWKRML
jgi:hypothetical protein